jgi:hypothetical protein
MKKTLAMLVFVMVTATTFAQTGTGLLNLNRYFSYFPLNKEEDITDNDYVWTSATSDYDRFAKLAGREYEIDTPLEFALLSYYSQPVLNIRPVEADAILPKNNPKLADMKLGAAVFQEIQILRFLGNTAAVGRHEGVLKFITDRKNVTRADIEKYYRDNIRGLVSEIVDEEFGRISFLLEGSPNGSYNVVLTSNGNQYILSYEGYFNRTKQTKTLPPASLEALSSEMSKNSDFNRTNIDQIRTQAALIPAVALSDAALNEIKTILTDFYISPSTKTYACIKEAHIVWQGILLSTRNIRYGEVYHAYEKILFALNEGLAQKVLADVRISGAVTTLTTAQQQRLAQLR